MNDEESLASSETLRARSVPALESGVEFESCRVDALHRLCELWHAWPRVRPTAALPLRLTPCGAAGARRRIDRAGSQCRHSEAQ